MYVPIFKIIITYFSNLSCTLDKMLILIYIFHCIFFFFFYSKPKFLERYVSSIEEGWDLTKEKASARLDLLNNTKAAWEGYGVGLENIAVEFEKGEEEIKKVKKRFNLQGIYIIVLMDYCIFSILVKNKVVITITY